MIAAFRHCDLRIVVAQYVDHGKPQVMGSLVVSASCLHHKMPDKRRWTTVEQRTFLEGYVPQYLEAQATRTYHKFWPGLYQAWFAKFPESEPQENDPTETEVEDDAESDVCSEFDDDGADAASRKRKRSARRQRARKLAKKAVQMPIILTPDQKLLAQKGYKIRRRKEKIQRYFRWHQASTKANRKKHSTPSSLTIFSAVPSRARRRLQEVEVYSRLFYDDRVAPTVAERLRVEGSGDAATRIRAIREVTQKLWEGEDDGIKATVVAKMAELPDVSGDAADNNLQVRTPQQYQDAIEELPNYLAEILRNIEKHTGLSASIMVGGPIPKAGGALSTTSVHIGKNHLGNTFGMALTDYDAIIAHPFQQFLRDVYSSDIRTARALHPSVPVTEQAAATPIFHDLQGMDIQDVRSWGNVLDPPPPPLMAASAPLVNEDQGETSNEQPGMIRNALEPAPSPIRQVIPPRGVNSPDDPILSQSHPLPLTDVMNDISTAAYTAEVPLARTVDVSPAQTPHLSHIVSFPSISSFAAGTALPGSSRERPRPKPAYTGRLGVSVEAEAKDAETALKAATDNETTIQPPDLEVDQPRLLLPALLPPLPHSPGPLTMVPEVDPPSPLPPPHSPETPAIVSGMVSGTSMVEDRGRRHRTLTEFGLQHAKEVEQKNAKAERLKLKRENLAKSGKMTGSKEAARTKSGRKGKK